MLANRNFYRLICCALLLCLPPWANLLQYWLHNPLYGYGIWVPFLAAYLFWQSKHTLEATKVTPEPSLLALCVIGVYLASLPLIWVVQVANPDWRLLDWLLSLGAFASLLALFYRTGGSPWVKAFWFPAFFLLTAVPWSTAAEQLFIVHAIPVTGRLACELLWLMGFPAVDSGKLIFTHLGPIQISEDCSGIRSFHLALMATCFWIGYFRLNKIRSCEMAIGAMIITLAMNVLRISALVAIVVKSNDLAMMERWHDRMGTVTLGMLVLALPALAWLLRPGAQPYLPFPSDSLQWMFPKWALPFILIWELGSVGGSEAWFRMHEAKSNQRSDYWGLTLNPARIPLKEIPVAANVRENYFFTEGHSLTWKAPNTAQWALIYMDFNRGALSACTHNIHRPEVCLGMNDFVLVDSPRPLQFSISGQTITLAHQVFKRGNYPVHLFHAYLQNLPDEDKAVDWSYQGRLRAAAMGLRSHRAELIYLTAEARYYTPDQAKRAAQDYLSQLLTRKSL